MSAFWEKYRDPRWQEKRLRIMERDGFACRCCHATTKTLHVHHLCYGRGMSPWEYADDFLVTVCEDCHEELDQHQKYLLSSIAWFHNFDLKAMRAAVREMLPVVLENQKPVEQAGRKQIADVIQAIGKE